MKQTSKLTRKQREFLRRKKIDYENCRVIEDTNKYLKIIRNDKDIETINKQNK